VESEKIISGSVLKGSLASCINRFCGTLPLYTPIDLNNKAVVKQFPDLARNFADIRFTHAFPCPPNAKERPVFIPLSTVKVSNQIEDVALLPEPVLHESEKASAFQIDWKNRRDKNGENIDNLFGWAEHRIVNKTRTAIHPQLRKAFENKLYTFQYISPYAPQHQEEQNSQLKNIWYSNIRLPESLDDETLEKLSQQLFHAVVSCWTYLGKRRVRVSINLEPGPVQPKMKSKTPVVDGMTGRKSQKQAFRSATFTLTSVY
jgi:hypothetical protein